MEAVAVVFSMTAFLAFIKSFMSKHDCSSLPSLSSMSITIFLNYNIMHDRGVNIYYSLILGTLVPLCPMAAPCRNCVIHAEDIIEFKGGRTLVISLFAASSGPLWVLFHSLLFLLFFRFQLFCFLQPDALHLPFALGPLHPFGAQKTEHGWRSSFYVG